MVDRTNEEGTRYEDDLLSRTQNVRSFARSLTHDVALAEDVAQEAMVQALTRRPVDHPRLGAWLSTVVRNRLYQEFRSQRRRSRREQVAGTEGDGGPSMSVAERNDLVRAVRSSVMELDEPYRSTVVMRYFHDMTPTDIASSLDIPVKTVKTRLSRGHVRLREKLDRRLGNNRSAWAMIGLIGVERDAAEPAVATGVSASTSTSAWLLFGLALVAALTVFVGVRVLGHGARPAALATERRAQEPAVATSGPDPVRDAHVPPSSTAPSTTSQVDFTGVVIDALGRPVAGAEVRYRELEIRLSLGQSFRGVSQQMLQEAADDDLITTADGSGRFAIRVEDPPADVEPRRSHGGFPLLSMEYGGTTTQRRGLLFATAEGKAPLFAAFVGRGDGDIAHHLVVAERSVVTGVAIGPDGAPVAKVGIGWRAPEGLRERIPASLTHAIAAAPSAVTDALGRFTIESLPIVAGAELTAVWARELHATLEAPTTPRAHLRVELVERKGSGPAMIGRITDGDGRPVPWGAVTDGHNVATADEAGRYRLETFEEPALDRIVAIARGFLPRAVDRSVVAGPGDGDVQMDFILDRSPLAIRGRVVDHRGAPLAGIRVGVEELTPLWDGTVETPICVEHVLELRGPDPFVGVVTGEDGRFEIVGLDDRSYRLRAAREGSSLFARTDPVSAGASGVEVVLGEGSPRVIHGRLVDRSGAPVVDAAIFLLREMSFLPRPGPDRAALAIRLEAGEVRTDARGEFALTCDDDTGLLVSTRAPGFVAADWRLRDLGDGDERVLLRRCRFRVDATHASPVPARFCLVDEQGAPLEVEIRRGPWKKSTTWVSIAEGRSEVVIVPESARRVRLRVGAELRDRDVELTPGELTTLTL